MKLLLRILLIMAMLALAWHTITHYAFRFKEGYPFLPLLTLALISHLLTRLRAASGTGPIERPAYDHQSFDRLLLILLAFAGAAAILNLRHEPPFEIRWAFRLATLTLFLHLIPTLIAAPFARSQLMIAALSCLGLIGVLWKGSINQPPPHRSTIEASTAPIRSSASSRPSLKAS